MNKSDVLGPAFRAFMQNRPKLTREGIERERVFSEVVASTRDIEVERLPGRKPYEAPLPGVYVLYVAKRDAYEIQLFPAPRTDAQADGREQVRFEDWVGDLLKESKEYIGQMGHSVEYYSSVEHPETKGPTETFCIYKSGMVLALGDSVVKSIFRRIVSIAKNSPTIPDSVKRAIG